ncbi:MAG: arginine repressor [Ignavibacteriales bacterium]|nr:MAG: arginine repressor [Ignavibacteriales bacterium]
MSAKLRRQYKIKELLNYKFISSHEDLLKALHRDSVEVTQATLSRDFAELGVVRIFTDRGPRYVLNADESGKQIAKLVGFEIISVEHSESLIVIRTLAGRAQGVAHYIDRLNKPEILGTVAGDDTVLVIPNTIPNLSKVVGMVKQMMAEPPSFKKKLLL